MLKPAVLQFGTGRFLLAHVDLFVSDALAAGQALGSVMVVQTTDSAASSARTARLALAAPYPVRIRGMERGQAIDRVQWCSGIVDAVRAREGWAQVCEAVAPEVQVIVSNTTEQGYELDPADEPSQLLDRHQVPGSFPAKLLMLLLRRWQRIPQAALSILPCELVERNGDTLRRIVVMLARTWQLPEPFVGWLDRHCVWANTLVDRIVSEPIEPVGAVAEPYALWAIERKRGLVLPCRHPAIVLTDDLLRHERLKLFLLNAGHTFLAECWLRRGLAPDLTVTQAMHSGLRDELEALWSGEIVPVFGALGMRDEALEYLVDLRERLANPFLAHRLADIALQHAQKKQRRLAPIAALAVERGLDLPQPRLRAALAGGGA